MRIVWRQDDRADLGHIPARLRWRRGQAIVLPGETADVPAGRVHVTVRLPGHLQHTESAVVRDEMVLRLDADRLERDPTGDDPPTQVKVDLDRWAPTESWQRWDQTLHVRGDPSGLKLSAARNGLQTTALSLASRTTPRRLLTVPPLGNDDVYRLVWVGAVGHLIRPRVEPTDAGGALLMHYLVDGWYDLAAVAARRVERPVGDRTLDWSRPSYTQLLIGYAFALGRDTNRLAAWVRRTAAFRGDLGTDGLLLAAESVVQRGRDGDGVARDLLRRAAALPPPALTFGGEIGLRLAYRLLPGSEAGASVGDAVTGWLRLFTRTDDAAAGVSVPLTRTTAPDIRFEPWFRRVRWAVSFAITRGRRVAPKSWSVRILRLPRELSMRNRPLMMTSALGVIALLAVLVGAAFVADEWAVPAAWMAFGLVQAVVLLAAGGYVGWVAGRERTSAAQDRAERAEKETREHREDAMAGRTLAAVLQVDGEEEETALARRHAQLAYRLYGTVVQPSSDQSPSGSGSSFDLRAP